MKKIETSKKLLIFISTLFILTIISCIAIYLYCLTACSECSYEFLITVITIVGGSFSTSVGFYFNKAKSENAFKLKKELLEIKYKYLKEFQAISDYEADQEMKDEFNTIENELTNNMDNDLSIDGV